MILFQTILSIVTIVLNIRVCLWLMGKFAEPGFTKSMQERVAWAVSLAAGCIMGLINWGENSYAFCVALVWVLYGIAIFVARFLFAEHRWMAVFVGLNYLFVSDLLEMLAKWIAQATGERVTKTESVFLGTVTIDYTNTRTVMLTAAFKIVLFVICFLVFREKRGNSNVAREENRSVDNYGSKKMDQSDTGNNAIKGAGKSAEIAKSKRLFGWLGLILCITEQAGEYALANILTADSVFPVNAVMLYLMVILLILLMGGMAYLYFEKKRSLDFQSKMLASLNAEYQAVTRLYRERETMYHDFKNHLLVLEDHLKNHRLEECNAYMERIREPFFQKTTAYKTGHAVLDLITGAKMREAATYGIEVREDIQGRIDFPLKLADEEVCALLGSLWDNAIEACAKLEIERRRIEYKLRIEKNLILFVMANPYDGILQGENGELLTTKEGGIHGVGWNHVNLIVEAHQGHLEYHTENGIFRVEIMFYHE